MGGSSKETQTTTAESKTQPWAAARPALTDLIGQLQGQIGQSGLNTTETGALDNLTASARQGNPYAGQIGMLAGDLFGGGTDRTGMVESAYGGLQSSLTPFARGDFVDPSKNEALQGYLSTIGNDVQNRVNSMFAGAGRDLSGMNQQTLARGIAEGTAPVLLNAYENERGRQMGAINSLYSGGINTAGMLSGLDQTALGNRQAGIGTSTAALQAKDAGANQLLAIEAQRRGIPLNNLGMISNMLIPIGGLGSSTNSSQTTVGQSQTPMGQQLLGGALGGAGLLGQMGAFGPGGWLLSGGAGAAGMGSIGAAAAALPLMFSDIRLKEDVAQVGELYDGQPVYRFRYAGDDTMRIGLMAQDVEKVIPGAVHDIGGFKAVDYEMATARAL